MAKVREQPTTSGNESPAGNATTPGWSARVGGAMQSITRALRPPRAPQPEQNGKSAATPPRQRSEMGRFLFGMMAYVVGSILLQYVLLIANNAFNLKLTDVQTLFPRNAPLVGNMTKFSLIYIMLLIALIWILYRTNIMPRDMFAGRNAAQRNAPPPATRGRGRAARRASTPTSTKTTTKTTTRSGATQTSSTARRTATSSRASSNGSNGSNGSNDSYYDRVKSIQRARRRKH